MQGHETMDDGDDWIVYMIALYHDRLDLDIDINNTLKMHSLWLVLLKLTLTLVRPLPTYSNLDR